MNFDGSLRRAAPLLIMVFVGAAVGAHYLKAAERPSPTARVSVVGDRVVEGGGGTRIDVVLRVASGAQDLGAVSVFWMVGLPGEDRPWEAPRYVAPEQMLSGLPAEETRTLEWIATPLDLPPGNYEVTAWVHQKLADGTSQHVAGGPVGAFSVSQPVPTTVRLSQESFNKPVGPLVLESLSMAQEQPTEQRVSVEVTLRNRGADPVSGRAQMVVGRFTDPEPFRTAFWQTDWANVPSLRPGETHTLVWNYPIGLPPGTYGLSVWLHTGSGSTFDHSHGTFNIPLRLGPNAMHIQRVHPATGEVRIREASLDSGNLHLVIDNDGVERTISANTERLPERRRFDWYRAPAMPMQSDPTFALEAHTERVLQLPVPVDCVAEERLVHVTLVAQPSAAPVVPADDVLVDVCA